MAGRAGVLEVLPFSQSELAGTDGDFLDVTFAGGSDRIRRLPTLVHRLRPWSRNPLARAVRRPEVHLVDTGLLCHLLNVGGKSLGRIESRELGVVTETYVVNELRKQATWAETCACVIS